MFVYRPIVQVDASHHHVVVFFPFGFCVCGKKSLKNCGCFMEPWGFNPAPPAVQEGAPLLGGPRAPGAACLEWSPDQKWLGETRAGLGPKL